MLVMRLMASSDATGQSLPKTTRPPASEMLFHIPPRAARSGPMLRPHAPSMKPGVRGRLLAGWPAMKPPPGCIDAMTPSLPKRGTSARSIVSMCSTR